MSYNNILTIMEIKGAKISKKRTNSCKFASDNLKHAVSTSATTVKNLRKRTESEYSKNRSITSNQFKKPTKMNFFDNLNEKKSNEIKHQKKVKKPKDSKKIVNLVNKQSKETSHFITISELQNPNKEQNKDIVEIHQESPIKSIDLNNDKSIIKMHDKGLATINQGQWQEASTHRNSSLNTKRQQIYETEINFYIQKITHLQKDLNQKKKLIKNMSNKIENYNDLEKNCKKLAIDNVRLKDQQHLLSKENSLLKKIVDQQFPSVQL